MFKTTFYSVWSEDFSKFSFRHAVGELKNCDMWWKFDSDPTCSISSSNALCLTKKDVISESVWSHVIKAVQLSLLVATWVGDMSDWENCTGLNTAFLQCFEINAIKWYLTAKFKSNDQTPRCIKPSCSILFFIFECQCDQEIGKCGGKVDSKRTWESCL